MNAQKSNKIYQTTKKNCQAKIDKNPGVCPGCGGAVTPIETVDNADNPTFWAGCESCMVFTYTVSERLYKTAQALLDYGEYRYEPRPYDASEGELEYWRSSESRGLCSRINKYVEAFNNPFYGREEVYEDPRQTIK